MTSSFPPGSGHNGVGVGKTYYISLHGTKQVVTKSDNTVVYLKDYTGSGAQKWKCVSDETNHLYFQTGPTPEAIPAYLCREDNGQISAYTSGAISSKARTFFHVARHARGGSFLTHLIGDVVNIVKVVASGAKKILQLEVIPH